MLSLDGTACSRSKDLNRTLQICAFHVPFLCLSKNIVPTPIVFMLESTASLSFVVEVLSSMSSACENGESHGVHLYRQPASANGSERLKYEMLTVR